jgi:uncharacterized protein (DUF2225 family)
MTLGALDTIKCGKINEKGGSFMAGLLSGLGDLGLGDLENIDIYGEKKDSESAQGRAIPKIDEKDLIYDHAMDCPVCGNRFTTKTIRTGKAKLIRTDLDLRPIYEGIDMTKYDVPLCPVCGYAALNRFFKSVSDTQIRWIKESISSKISLKEHKGDIYTYEDALERYKLALVCAVVKKSKDSEKAYLCLKSAWLLRGYQEYLLESGGDHKQQIEQLKAEEMNYLKNAFEGFAAARTKERPPFCGMDEITTDYLIAVLAYRFRKFDVASHLIAGILGSAAANNRMKDKTRDLKDMILVEMRKEKK